MSSLWERITDRLAAPPIQTPPAPSPIMQETFTVTLPSIIDGASFRASFTVSWHRHAHHPDGGGAIVRYRLGAWAAQRSARKSPSQYEALESELTFQMRSFERTQEGIWIVGGSVILGVTAEAEKAGAEWDALQRQLALDRVRRQVDLAELEYLREEVFCRPKVARSLWLKRHPDSFTDVLDDRFERVAEKLGATAEESDDLVTARLLVDFVQGMSLTERQYLLAQLGQVFTSFGRDDLAKRLPE